MEPNQTYKLLHSKESHKQGEKTIYGLGENICKQCDLQGLNFQNIQIAYTTNNNKRKTQKTQLKNGQKTQIDISLRNTYRANRHMKSCSSSLIIKKGKSKLQCGTTSHQLEWPLLKSLQIRGFLVAQQLKKKKKKSAFQCKKHGSDSWAGKIPHATEQLNLCTTAIEPVLQRPGAKTTELMCHNDRSLWALEPVLSSKVSPCSEKSARHVKEQPPAHHNQREAHAAMKTQNSQK